MRRIIFVIFAAAFLLLSSLYPFPARADHDEVYDRVMKSGTIKCGYFIWPPFIEKDLTTGKISGFFPDLVEETGKELGLKIDWVEEVSWASIFEGYAAGRYDMICGPLFMTPGRARGTDFTAELFYVPIYLYAREGDARFDDNYAAANDPAVKFAYLDGEYSQTAATDFFPKAQSVSTAGLTDGATQIFMDIASGKADLTATEPTTGKLFMDANPGKIRQAAGDPLVLFPVAMPVPQGEYKFRRMLDITLKNLHDKKYVEGLLKKYLPQGITFYPVDGGYKPSGKETQ